MIRSQPPRAVRHVPVLVLLLVMSTCLTGCEVSLGTFLLVALVVVVVTPCVLLTVLIVNIVKLLRGRPSLGWGVTSLVCGGLYALFFVSDMVSRNRADFVIEGIWFASIVLSGALIYFGLRNVKGAKKRATFSTGDPAIEPPPAPPPPPPGTLAPPWP